MAKMLCVCKLGIRSPKVVEYGTKLQIVDILLLDYRIV